MSALNKMMGYLGLVDSEDEAYSAELLLAKMNDQLAKYHVHVANVMASHS